MMKLAAVTLFLALAAFLANGTAALACNRVTATISDASTNGEFPDGGILMIIDDNFASPIASRVSHLSGGQFSVTVPADIGKAKAVLTLYTPEGKEAIPPIIRDVTMNGSASGNPCVHIAQTVNNTAQSSLPRYIIAF